MKKFIIMLCLLLGLCSFCYAATEDVTVLLNRQIKVTYNDQVQEFQNVYAELVFPISYNGTTYLPIRSISSLFGTEIRWDGETNSVYLGEGELDMYAATVIDRFIARNNEDIVALLNGDISIYYNGEKQTFYDVNGTEVFPLSYEGTTYLPVRAVSNLFGLSIDWDEDEYAVRITGERESYNSYIDENEYNFEDSGEEFNDEDYYSDDDVVEDVYDIEDNENDGIFTFTDEQGKEISYYFDDEGEIKFFRVDEDGEVINFYYDENGEEVIY